MANIARATNRTVEVDTPTASVGSAVVRFGGVVIRQLRKAGDNFASVRGADLLQGIVPTWVQRALQTVLPSTLFTRLSLPGAFLFDLVTYSTFDEILNGFSGPTLDYWRTQLIEAMDPFDAYLERQKTRQVQAGMLAFFLNQSFLAAADGSQIVYVPPLQFRDP